MRREQTLPEPYRSSKRSKYRRNIASLAKPLPTEIVKVLEMGNACKTFADSVSGVLTDLHAFERECLRFVESGLVSTEDMQNLDIIGLLGKVFDENGVLFDKGFETMLLGIILHEENICGVETRVAALRTDNRHSSVYLPERRLWSDRPSIPPRLVLDATQLLEQAVYRINHFRYRELEPFCSTILTAEERKSPTKELVKKRVDGILPRGELDLSSFENAIEELREGRAGDELGAIMPRILTIRLMGLPVRETFSEDEVQHTLNLCNLVARSTLIAGLTCHCETERTIRMFGAEPGDIATNKAIWNFNFGDLDFVTWLADMAYGTPYLRMSTVQYGALTSGPTPGMMTFMECGLGPMLAELDFLPSSDSEQERISKYHKVLNCPEEEFRRVAAIVLDMVYTSRTGKGFFENFPELREAFDFVNSSEFVKRKDLPGISQVWKGVYPIEQR